MTDRSGARTRTARSGARKKGAAKAGRADPKTDPDPEESSNAFAELSFEDALAQLEGIVDRLEEGDLDLADALARFEDGVQLTRHCQAQLEAAERRVEVLTREGGDWSTRPFQSTESAVEEDAD